MQGLAIDKIEIEDRKPCLEENWFVEDFKFCNITWRNYNTEQTLRYIYRTARRLNIEALYSKGVYQYNYQIWYLEMLIVTLPGLIGQASMPFKSS